MHRLRHYNQAGDAMKILNKVLGAAALILAASMPVAQADVVYSFTNPAYSGADLPGVVPGQIFATGTFSQIANGDLQLRLDVTSLVGASIITAWYFNINVDPATLSFANAIDPAAVDASSMLQRNQNTCCSADGTGEHDFAIFFDPSTAELAGGHYALINISSSTTDLTLAMLAGQLSVMPNHTTGFGAAIHVQRIPQGEGSGWFVNCIPSANQPCEPPGEPEGNPTPEPGTLALLGLGFGVMAYRRRKQ